ncbi:MAG TPA: cytochrome P450 [Candidatus Deferrimicrobiaceae bacterium]|nr:cytochrome P450 [Candidatus Deferrimicrobiaceae bacterium]
MADVQFNPMDPEFVADPYPMYHRLRAEDPVHHSPLGFWVLTRYPDVMAMLRDPRLIKEPIAAFVAARFGMAVPPGLGLSMLDRDPPDHTRLRGLVSKAFTPRALEKLRPGIQQIVDGLLDEAAGRGSMDLIEEFAYPLPVRVICEMLGVPVQDHERFKAWGLDIARGLDAIMLPPDSPVGQRSVSGRRALAEYFRELIAERRAAPREDMLAALIAAEEAGDKLNEEELLATCILLLVAGHETTVNLIGNGTLALLRHPDQLRKLRESPGLIGTAVEELLRFDGPVQRTARIPSEDITIGGQTIGKGEMVMPFLGAADRDPTQFPDPDRLDISRTDNRHIAFGMGIHFCLGAPLARMEGQIAINTLLARLPKLALATDRPQFRQSLTLRGLQALPVTF